MQSTVFENIARGFLGGCPPSQSPTKEDDEYDTRNAKDLERSWNQAVHRIINGDLIDELFDSFAKSGKLEDQTPMVQAAIKHIFLM